MTTLDGPVAMAVPELTAPELTAAAKHRSKEDIDFQDLARRVRAAGLMSRPPWHAGVRLALTGLLYGAGWAALVLVGNSWYQLLVAVYLAVIFTQVGFLDHDVGHRQIFRTRRLNRVVGLACGNLGIGISFGYWVVKHNQHHAHPNQVGADPDVGPGVISWTPEQVATKTGLGRAVARHQAGLFFPLTCLEAVSLHVVSAQTMWAKGGRRAHIELILLAAHIAAYASLVFLVMSPLRAVAFLVVQQGLFGLYLGCAFAPNHKGMEMPSPGQDWSFVQRQVTTSRNVKGNRVLDVVMGGLNYQIEHHLFPTMPMVNLRRCQPMVREYCLSHDIGYCETRLFRSYVIGLRHLRSTGRAIGADVPRT
jgi:fatty acid desaturase